MDPTPAARPSTIRSCTSWRSRWRTVRHHGASYTPERARRPSTVALWRKIRTVGAGLDPRLPCRPASAPRRRMNPPRRQHRRGSLARGRRPPNRAALGVATMSEVRTLTRPDRAAGYPSSPWGTAAHSVAGEVRQLTPMLRPAGRDPQRGRGISTDGVSRQEPSHGGTKLGRVGCPVKASGRAANSGLLKNGQPKVRP
jgi:hypothetical protein